MMDKNKTKPKYYYSTYSSGVYEQKAYDNDATYYHSEDDKQAGNKPTKIEDKQNAWLSFFNIRTLIILISVVLGSVLFSAQMNSEPKSERFLLGSVIAPPNVFDIKVLQIPFVGSKVGKNTVFEDFIKNIKSAKNASQFAGSDTYHHLIKIQRGVRIGESVDSVEISIEAEKPELAQQWLAGFLVFAEEQTIKNFVENAKVKIRDKQDKIQLEIDTIYKNTKAESQISKDKIERYKKAAETAKNKGIMNKISASSLPKEQQFGDLLYLQGYWKLEAEIMQLTLALERQVVDVTAQQQTLQGLTALLPSAGNIKVFSMERALPVKDLTNRESKQTVWNILGGFIGYLFGLIISYPFKRKKASLK